MYTIITIIIQTTIDYIKRILTIPTKLTMTTIHILNCYYFDYSTSININIILMIILCSLYKIQKTIKMTEMKTKIKIMLLLLLLMRRMIKKKKCQKHHVGFS